MESQASTVNSKKLIFVPAQYDDPAYRLRVYVQWVAEAETAAAMLTDINSGGPYYGTGWRVD
jgi:hypothetical protein